MSLATDKKKKDVPETKPATLPTTCPATYAGFNVNTLPSVPNCPPSQLRNITHLTTSMSTPGPFNQCPSNMPSSRVKNYNELVNLSYIILHIRPVVYWFPLYHHIN